MSIQLLNIGFGNMVSASVPMTLAHALEKQKIKQLFIK